MSIAKKARTAKNVIVGGAALLYVFAWLAGIWTLVVLGTLVLLPVVLWKLRRASEGTQGAAKTLAVLVFAAPINFAALVASRRWGLYAICAVAALMLLDASFGSDGIGFPVVGWWPVFLAALVVGGYDWWWRSFRTKSTNSSGSSRRGVRSFDRCSTPTCKGRCAQRPGRNPRASCRQSFPDFAHDVFWA